jgi:hypothetical protein
MQIHIGWWCRGYNVCKVVMLIRIPDTPPLLWVALSAAEPAPVPSYPSLPAKQHFRRCILKGELISRGPRLAVQVLQAPGVHRRAKVDQAKVVACLGRLAVSGGQQQVLRLHIPGTSDVWCIAGPTLGSRVFEVHVKECLASKQQGAFTGWCAEQRQVVHHPRSCAGQINFREYHPQYCSHDQVLEGPVARDTLAHKGKNASRARHQKHTSGGPAAATCCDMCATGAT